MAKFCERIRELRMERGLKQREMAAQFGLAVNSYQPTEIVRSLSYIPAHLVSSRPQGPGMKTPTALKRK